MYRNLPLMVIATLGITACSGATVTYPSGSGYAHGYLASHEPIVNIGVIGDNSGNLPNYPVVDPSGNHRAYLQAVPSERYRLKISNNSDTRVGVVVAVDGRNIISGQKSYLQNTERMYILEPHTSSEYDGWRTSGNQVNRFYFTETSNSYAEAWGDSSAMGVIAMAVYPEQPRPEAEAINQISESASERADSPQPKAPASAYRQKNHKVAPGTGFGEKIYSPSQLVNFEPLPESMEKVFLKYEWHETLCQKKIIATCSKPIQPPQNRFWPDNNGYALPPPR